MGEGPAHLLFERQKEARGENKCGEPQCDDWLEVLFTEGFLADLKKGVTRDSCDEQTPTDRQSALGEGNSLRVGRLGRKGLVRSSQDL